MCRFEKVIITKRMKVNLFWNNRHTSEEFDKECSVGREGLERDVSVH